MLRKAIILLLCLTSPCAMAAEMTCKKSPALTGKCSTVKGSLGLTPGIGVTLVSEDGNRIVVRPPLGHAVCIVEPRDDLGDGGCPLGRTRGSWSCRSWCGCGGARHGEG